MKPLVPGDYVLATKWHNGDPRDHWFVGFFSGMMCDRFFVVDSEGKQARAGGFRRAKKISAEVGRYIVENKENIETGCRSLWSIIRAPVGNQDGKGGAPE